MKKNYSKPVLAFNDFAFISNVAGGCADVNSMLFTESTCVEYATFSSISTCSYVNRDLEMAVFLSRPTCSTIAQNGSFGNICYHVAADTSKLFSS